MKKLRKTFALIMALVMLAGVFTFAAPAALADDPDTAPIEYADHDAINEDYETAIQVFSKMKVIEGIGGNNFDPAGNLTRAAGAAMLSRALLSREGVDQFGAFGSRFKDLPAGEEHQWMVGPIAYLDSRHIMAGVGDNMFNPTGELTKIQWVRMMLSTLGYGAHDEFVGPGWDSNVLRFAMQQDIDIFGIFNGSDPDIHPSPYTNQNRLVVPRNDLTDPIAREEAIALLFNIVTIIEKVEASGNSYQYVSQNPGLAGGVQALIMGDIGLDKDLDDPRDHYGRPLEWSTDWVYLNAPLVNTPADAPERFGEEAITPNMTGVQLRTTLQRTIDDVMALKEVSIYANNGEKQADPATVSTWYKLRSTLIPASLSSLPVFATATPTGIPSGQTFAQYYSRYNDASGDAMVLDTAWSYLEAYLDGRGSSPAFGPGVKIELYKDGDGNVDIIIISQFLTELVEKRVDDTRTLLVDESSLRFNLFYETAPEVSATKSITELPPDDTDLEDIPELSLGWDTIYDDWAVGSSFISTPHGSIDPNGFLVGDSFNKVYEPARVISAVAGSSTATWVYLGDTSYDLALVSPTVNRGDRTNNYDFFLNEDDVIIGAKYAAPGKSSIGGYLYLATATGLKSDGTPTGSAFAVASVVLGGGPSVWRDVNLRIRGNDGGQVWHPNPNESANTNWVDLPTYTASPAFGNLEAPWGGGADAGITPGWYSYIRLSDGTIQLGQVEEEDGYDWQAGANVTISRGRSAVGGSNQATTRTLFARMTANGTTEVANFNNFPTIDRSPSSGGFTNRKAGAQALYKYEPGSGTRVAEIFYIDLSNMGAGAETLFGFLVSPGTGFGLFNLVRPVDYARERVTVTRASVLQPLNTLFYSLVDDGEGVFAPTQLYDEYVANGYYLVSGYVDIGSVSQFQFVLNDKDGDYIGSYEYHADRMPILTVGDMRETATFAGYDDDIRTIGDSFVVLVIDNNSTTPSATRGRPIAAFEFNNLVDRSEIPGLTP